MARVHHRLAMNGLSIKPALHHALRPLDGAAAAGHQHRDVTGLADFNRQAGVSNRFDAVHPHRTIHTRFAAMRSRTTSRPTLVPRSARKSGGNSHLRGAAIETMEALRLGERAALEAALASEYDVLEQHTLLREARLQVDESAFDPEEKNHLKSQLNEMMTDLMDEHGDVIRVGLRDAHAFETAVGRMDALSKADGNLHDPNAIYALRGIYGAKTHGQFDTPFTPLALVRSLQDKFGANNVSDALADLRSTMSAGLRSSATTGPRLWLSLRDAACFNMVQSSVAVAGDLRGELSERARIVPKADQIGTAMALLEVAETGTGTAAGLVDRIAERKDLVPLQQMQLYMLVRQAVGLLATTAWSEEHLPHRMTLLDELRTLAVGASSNTSKVLSEEEQLVLRLRDEVDAVGRRNAASRAEDTKAGIK